MKLTAVAKTERGITEIIVFDVKTRAELVKSIPTCAVCTIFERHPFKLDMKPGDAVDAVTLAGRLELPSDCEVF